MDASQLTSSEQGWPLRYLVAALLMPINPSIHEVGLHDHDLAPTIFDFDLVLAQESCLKIEGHPMNCSKTKALSTVAHIIAASLA